MDGPGGGRAAGLRPRLPLPLLPAWLPPLLPLELVLLPLPTALPVALLLPAGVLPPAAAAVVPGAGCSRRGIRLVLHTSHQKADLGFSKVQAGHAHTCGATCGI